MKLNEAKQILERNGALVESEFDYTEEISKDELDAENAFRKKFYTLKEHLDDLYEKYNSKSKDYVNGHVNPRKWKAIKNSFKVELFDVAEEMKQFSLQYEHNN